MQQIKKVLHTGTFKNDTMAIIIHDASENDNPNLYASLAEIKTQDKESVIIDKPFLTIKLDHQQINDRKVFISD